MTVSVAAQLRADRIPVNTFRIDVPVASEGFVHNSPDWVGDDWEPCFGARLSKDLQTLSP